MYYNSAYITTLLNVTLLYLNLHLRLFLCKATPTSSRLHTVKVISSLRSGVLHHTGKRGQYMMPTLRNLTSKVQGKRTPNAAISKNTRRRSSSRATPTTSTESQGRVSATAVTLGAVASIGGFIFGQ
jgi:hypothetical protein